MSPLSSTFTGKVLTKLGKVGRDEIERFLEGVVRERNFYEAVFEALSEGVAIMDTGGQVLLLNRVARRMLGVRPGRKVLGRPLLDAIGDDELRALFTARGHERLDHVPVTTAQSHDLLVTLVPVRESGTDSLLARVLILADVTETRRHERERARAERLSGLSLLTAGVAHEIKNPLNSLRIHGQLLEQALTEATWPSEIQGERSARSAAIILEETQRLTRIVEQFLQAVRPVEPRLVRHSLNVILRRAIEATAPHGMEPAIELELDLDTQLPDVLVDDQQMTQVFMNLLRNAAESLDKPARRIRVSTRTAGPMAEVTIADNGCGISPEHLERIYQPYFTTKYNGTGLGLMVVHRIVEDHGGRILITSREGEGTEVTVLLPLPERPTRLLAEGKRPS
ncbi:MAG: PAS domain-containing protein [Candidatus Sumerlaeia bacterium]|nr:PAS domain-containing protein [Candidatus Sumerlaeia bacterium]